MHEINRLLKIDEVAEMLGLSVSYVYNLVYRGEIPHIKLSRRALRFDPAALVRWVESKARKTAPRT